MMKKTLTIKAESFTIISGSEKKYAVKIKLKT
jgi:hypothetical protein